jgi:hypothetical protein
LSANDADKTADPLENLQLGKGIRGPPANDSKFAVWRDNENHIELFVCLVIIPKKLRVKQEKALQ